MPDVNRLFVGGWEAYCSGCDSRAESAAADKAMNDKPRFRDDGAG
jgi:hypothetical protein